MTKITGLVYSILRYPVGEEEVVVHAHRLKEETSPGRLCAVLWDIENEWKVSTPLEASVTRAFLGNPQDRNESNEGHDWTLFGTLVTRLYQDDPWKPTRTGHVSLFRRRGEPAYTRLRDATTHTPDDKIDTTAYSFTRDVANNIWHLPDTPASELMIVARLANLVCWSDEGIIEIMQDGQKIRRDEVRTIKIPALIGVAKKERYDLSQETLDF